MPRFLSSLARIFTPPFNGLALTVVLYFIGAHLICPHNDVLRGNFPDPDNYMYLAQVLDWLKGQSWYDDIQHRMNPPQGVAIPFSRFAQIPLAAGILFFEQLGLPARGAAILTALIEPLILLGLCLCALRRVAARVVDPAWAGASAYIALFSVTLLYEFMPGHVDHHGLVIILILTILACAFRLLDEPHNLITATLTGFLLAFTLMIALESLPWIVLIAAALGLWTIKHGQRAAQSGAALAATFFLSSIVCLLLTRPPSQFFTADVLVYSFVYILLAAAIAAPFGVVALIREKPLLWRALAGLGTASLGIGLFLSCFPTMATGPYGALDPRLVRILLSAVEEAKPITQTENGLYHLYNLMSLGSVSLLSSLVFAWKGQAATREKWILIALLQATAMGLTLFYQYRFLGIECALAIIPLTALLHQGWLWIGKTQQGRRKVFAEIGLLLALGPLPAVFIPALFDGRSFNTGVLLFPVEQGRTACDMARLEKILRNPYELGDKPRLILSQMELGPELLFRTDHAVLAAPYHMNVQGNVDSMGFLTATDENEAAEILRRRGVDLVVACRTVPGIYMPKKGAAPTFMTRLFQTPPPLNLTLFPSAVLNNFIILKSPSDRPAPDSMATSAKKESGN